MEESTALNIIYLPDEATRNKAIELSRKILSDLPVEFILGQGTIPHITIYQASFPTRNLQRVKEIVKEISSEIEPFQVEMGPFFVNVVRGFVWWNCIKSDQLVRVHWKTIDSLNPLREGLIPATLKNYPATEEEEMELKNYGAFLMGKRYPPHITLTRLKNPEDEKRVFKILGKEERSVFTADKIAIGLMGDHGTVTEIIEEFPLAS